METEFEVPKPGTELGNNTIYVLEAHRSDKTRNVNALLLIPGTVQPFVSCIMVGSATFMYGHYYANVNEALTDYLERR